VASGRLARQGKVEQGTFEQACRSVVPMTTAGMRAKTHKRTSTCNKVITFEAYSYGLSQRLNQSHTTRKCFCSVLHV
jgi:hypothetical protein